MKPPRVSVRPPQDRQPALPAPGIERETAYAGNDRWAGLARTQPGMVSGWHHHDGWDTYAYVVSGKLRLEFGPDGSETVEAGPGDFVHVPAHTVHREGNPSDQVADVIVFRVGDGEIVVEVDGPDPG
ncbi:MAG: cupin domain-containing protein [Nitriliruptorales bacterium]